MRKTAILALCTLAMLPIVGFAQVPTQPVQSPINSYADVISLIKKIAGIMQGLLYVLATVFIIIAAFKYLTSGGDEAKTKEAKNMIVYAIVAVAVALIAAGVSAVVANLLGASVPSGT